MTTTYQTEDKTEEGVVAVLKLLGALAAIGAAVLSSILSGWVMHDLWAWFLVPLGVQPVGLAQAMGISGLVGLVTYRVRKPDHMPSSWQMAFTGALYALVVWGLCAIYHHFM